MRIEDRLEKLEKRVAKIEGVVFDWGRSSKSSGASELERKLVGKIDEMRTQHLVVIALKLKPRQTRVQIKAMLEEWGKVVGDWFKGGNMNNRLIKKNIVKVDGVGENNEDLFSLTKKGELLAQELIDKVKGTQFHPAKDSS